MPNEPKDYKRTVASQLDLNWDGVEELDEDEVPPVEEEKQAADYKEEPK
jgi:hypothetical protein